MTPFFPLAAVIALGCGYGLLLERIPGGDGRAGRPPLVLAGLALLGVAVSPSVHEAADTLLAAHMAQHVLLGDLAPLLLAAGLSGVVLRPVLAPPAARPLRHLLHPLAAVPLWIAVFTAWHVPAFYDAAVRSDVVHGVEHVSFFAAGLVLWMCLLETLPGPAWFGGWAKLGALLLVAVVEMAFGNALFLARAPFYGAYDGAWGLGALADQQLAGAVMLSESSIVLLVVGGVLFLRALRESAQRQALLDAGLDARRAARRARYARG